MNILKYISHTKAILQQHLEYRSNFWGGVLGEPYEVLKCHEDLVTLEI